MLILRENKEAEVAKIMTVNNKDLRNRVHGFCSNHQRVWYITLHRKDAPCYCYSSKTMNWLPWWKQEQNMISNLKLLKVKQEWHKKISRRNMSISNTLSSHNFCVPDLFKMACNILKIQRLLCEVKFLNLTLTFWAR